MSSFAESVVDEAAFTWLQGLGHALLGGAEIPSDEPFAEEIVGRAV
jgi:hypothetical protein